MDFDLWNLTKWVDQETPQFQDVWAAASASDSPDSSGSVPSTWHHVYQWSVHVLHEGHLYALPRRWVVLTLGLCQEQLLKGFGKTQPDETRTDQTQLDLT
jgi:hypothetical protein